MRIAVCVSGQLRMPEHYSDDLVRMVNCLKADVYFSVWSRTGASVNIARLFPTKYLRDLFFENKIPDVAAFRKRYPRLHSMFVGDEVVTQERISNIFPDACIELEDFPTEFDKDLALHGVSFAGKIAEYSHVRNRFSLPMYYKRFRANELLRRAKKAYDRVVIIRNDAVFTDLDKVIEEITAPQLEANRVLVAANVDVDHVGDMFLAGSQEVISRVCELWNSLGEYWSKDEALGGLDYSKRVAGYLLHAHIQSLSIDILNSASYVHLNQKKQIFSFFELEHKFRQDLGDLSKASPRELMALRMVRELLYEQMVRGGNLKEIDYKSCISNFLDDGEKGAPLVALSKCNTAIGNVSAGSLYLERAYSAYREFWPEAAVELCRHLKRQHEFIRGALILTENVLRFPDHGISWRELGSMYESLNAPKLALVSYEEAERHGVGNLQAHIARLEHVAAQ